MTPFEKEMLELNSTGTQEKLPINALDEDTGELVVIGERTNTIQHAPDFYDFTEESLADAKPQFSVTSKYWEAVKNVPKRFKFAGIEVGNFGQGDKEVAMLIGFENGVKVMYDQSGVQLVKELHKVLVGSIVEICLKEEKPVGNNGAKVKLFSVMVCQ
jgi:hypothetical protein